MNGGKRFVLGMVRITASVMVALLKRWPLLLIIAFFYFDEGPHLYWSGEYRKFGGSRVYIECTYIGSRGPVHLDFRYFNDDCPQIMWIDPSEVVP